MKWSALIIIAFATIAYADPKDYFVINVVDDQTNRGVPLIELKTTNDIRLYTDSAGVIAFNEPGLMNQRVFFHISSHGYEYPKDGFGIAGKAFDITPGGSATVKIKRINIAQRLYRTTGGGIYRDSILAGKTPPTKQPLLNAKVFGQDTIQRIIHNNKIHWFWGDTNRPAYPLGHFGMSGATSDLPSAGGLDPSLGIDYTYFTGPEGFARPTVPGENLRWIDGLVILKDVTGKDRLVARVEVLKSLGNLISRHLIIWNDAKNEFDRLADFDKKENRLLQGHPIVHEGYIYNCNPYPITRVKADFASIQKPDQYEGLVYEAGAWIWKRGVTSTRQDDQEKQIKSGQLKHADARFALRNVDTNDVVLAHAGTINWNAYRKKWIMITHERYGKSSFLGEVYYAESDAIEGPWLRAKKIATHDRYSFYNPAHHPFFDQDAGRTIYFEGTYTGTFSRKEDLTPRYEYNNIMYKLDLADPRLKLE